MAKMWDDRMKRLVWAAPQDFTTWLMPGAIFIERVTLELKNLMRSVNPDTLYKINWHGQAALLHIEFQKRADPNMAKRVWQYNVLATLAYDCPVYSFVIYLVADSGITEPGLDWGLKGAARVHDFHFTNVKLWELPVEALKETGLAGLLPLLILAKDGQQHKVAEEVFDNLAIAKRGELLALSMLLASMVFTNEQDKQWLERRQAMLEDILSDTWLYQKLLKEGEQKGLEKGLEKGREEGKLNGMRLMVLEVVQERFPEIVDKVKDELDNIDDPAILKRLVMKMGDVKNAHEAARAFFRIAKGKAGK